MVTSGPPEAVLLLTLRPNVCTSQLHKTSVTAGNSEGARGRDQEPRPCVLFCLAVSTARTPIGALRVAGPGPGLRLEPPVGKPGLGHVGAVPTTATPGPQGAARAGQRTLASQGPRVGTAEGTAAAAPRSAQGERRLESPSSDFPA